MVLTKKQGLHSIFIFLNFDSLLDTPSLHTLCHVNKNFLTQDPQPSGRKTRTLEPVWNRIGISSFR